MTVWEATLSSKGQVTIPKEMREALKLRPGDTLVYCLIDGEVIMTPKNIDLKDLVGLLGEPPGGPATLEEIEDAAVKAAADNVFDMSDDNGEDVAA
ncbi:AbrB/MazE/SpoVT family DNA-binding domain-containing protein [Rhizobium oryzicola]|uniref:AbrB/MazE/SpoVT family DNA-binding domain-containing protein n=1 Tax=Rhizobium oryzicola TaxID=1232668 RepID=A0ABT8SUT1_9HYPH|nr:AbrB/MazE/SpoVT family DNA-binding domain-containing protein [Rhizobium oryzicola]MDO1582050.1 AbrB/MazE/SpoVT family DNA-binding domain-containing protein [Rhizobium oryzicola]